MKEFSLPWAKKMFFDFAIGQISLQFFRKCLVKRYFFLNLQSQFLNIPAQVAELVDALVSGTSVRKYVKVRVLSWAQNTE